MKRYFLAASVTLNILLVIYIGNIYSERLLSLFKKHYAIVFFGDSLTFNGDWGKLTENDNTKTSGFPGFTSSHLVWLVKEHVIKYHPDTCYIMAGVNDIGVGIPLERTEHNFKSIVDSLMANKIVPIVQSTLLTSDLKQNWSIDSLNTRLAILAKSRGIKFLNINKVVSKVDKIDPLLTTDGTHLNEKGYKKWASFLRSNK